jgi:hypothetical protein
MVLIKDQWRFAAAERRLRTRTSHAIPPSVYLGLAVAVSHQVVVFDGLSLLMPAVLPDAFTDEGCYLELEGTLLSAAP